MKSNQTQLNVFDNAISIEKLEERLEMTSAAAADVTCIIIVV
jgi:hypothetical protein